MSSSASIFRPRDPFSVRPKFRKPEFSTTCVFQSAPAARVYADEPAFVVVVTIAVGEI